MTQREDHGQVLVDALRVAELAWEQSDLAVLEGLAFNLLPALRAAVAAQAATQYSVFDAIVDEMLAMHPGRVQEADRVWPIVNVDVGEDGTVTNAKLYAPGLPAGNHDCYPVVPYLDEHSEAWFACLKALEEVRPGFIRAGKTGIDAAVLAIRSLGGAPSVPTAGE